MLLAFCEGTQVDSLRNIQSSDAELWCFLWSAPAQTIVQTIGTPVIWDAIVFIMTHCNDLLKAIPTNRKLWFVMLSSGEFISRSFSVFAIVIYSYSSSLFYRDWHNKNYNHSCAFLSTVMQYGRMDLCHTTPPHNDAHIITNHVPISPDVTHLVLSAAITSLSRI